MNALRTKFSNRSKRIVRAEGGTRIADPFMEGFAIALADLVRLHDQPSMAADVIAGHGFTLKDFKSCDDYDLKVIPPRDGQQHKG